MKKQSISFLLIAVVLITMTMGSFSTAYAVEPENNNTPMMSYISTIHPDLSFSGSTASLKCSVRGILGTTTKITVAGTLQRYVSGTWVDVSSSSQTENNYRMTYSRSATTTKGYSYRAKYVVKAYAGSAYETRTVYSKTVVLS